MNPDQFEDPGLKIALKRIYGGERAPAALRERLMRSLAEASPMSPVSPSTVFTDRPAPTGPIRVPFWSLPSFRAAAALFLLAVAGIFYYASNTSAASPIQQDALLAMIQTHDQCCAENQEAHQDAGLSAPVLDRTVVGQALAQKLKQAIWVPDLSQEGWRLAGAAICTVGARKSAHLIYAKGDNKLSVFSMSGEGCSSKEGACGTELQDHVIAGMARGGAVYCVVGHCPEKKIKLHHVDEILDRHRDEVITVAVATPADQPAGR